MKKMICTVLKSIDRLVEQVFEEERHDNEFIDYLGEII